MIRRFLGAVQFLTVLPVRGTTASPGEGAFFFPLTGAMLGVSAGAVKLALGRGLGQSLAAMIALAWLMAVSGCLHEDGLADVADAVRAGRSREKIMDILKDSRIGTYGAIALVLSIGLRWQALAQSSVNPVAALAAAVTFSRTSMVVLAAITPAIGQGLGRAFAAACTPAMVLAVAPQSILVAAVAAVFIGWVHAVALIVSTVVLVFAARWYFTRRVGGVNGDCLGAASQAVEIVNLVILAWRPSI
jgi:adenosylcobinamide-GDP ribazoletransferase